MKESKIGPKKVEELLAKSVVVDGHNHIFMELTDQQQNRDEIATFENFCAPRLAKGG